MGTNFYRKGKTHRDDPPHHIGKRSAAGFYCWDCRATLCKEGEAGIHNGISEWRSKCILCGTPVPDESLSEGAAGKELGFNKDPLKRKGVASICSFTWAVEPESIKRLKFVEDEYGKVITFQEFLEILKDCPVQFKNMIGHEFS